MTDDVMNQESEEWRQLCINRGKLIVKKNRDGLTLIEAEKLVRIELVVDRVMAKYFPPVPIENRIAEAEKATGAQ